MTKKLYIIGSGLAGLSAAIYSQKKNVEVEIYESAKFSGGRCRSFHDKKTNIIIDNGNHLVFSANKNFEQFCKTLNSTNTLKTLPPNFFFYDSKYNVKWNLDLSLGYFNFLRNKNNLIPKSKPFDYLSLFKFFFVRENSNVYDVVGESKIYKNFWEPLTLGVMNTSPKKASAKVLFNVLKKTILKGPQHCRIYQPKDNWNKTLIEPAIREIKKKGGKIFYGNLLKKINVKNNRITELFFSNKKIKVSSLDKVLLSIPPTNVSKLLNQLKLPDEYNTILNIHFKINLKDINLFDYPIVGFINTISQWIFIKKDHISVTVSDANILNSVDANVIVKDVWTEICLYLNKKIHYESFQIVREKKATYIQSPINRNLIKKLKNTPDNLILSGDWTQYNLPCTIEASILSGKNASNLT